MNLLDRYKARILNTFKISLEDWWDDLRIKYLGDDYRDRGQPDVWEEPELPEQIGVKSPVWTELLTRSDDSMFRYRNLNNNSGVAAYDTGVDWFLIKFNDSSLYLYTTKSTTIEHINYMRTLAREGKGLNSYVNRIVGNQYAGRNYKGNLTLMPGMESISNPKALRALQLIIAHQNTLKGNDMSITLEHFEEMEKKSGKDGLEPNAQKALVIAKQLLGEPTVSSEGLLDAVKKFFTPNKDKGIYDTVNKGFLQSLSEEVKKYANPSWVKTHGTNESKTIQIEGANLIGSYDKVVSEFITECKANRAKQHEACEIAFKNMDEVISMIDRKQLNSTENVQKAITIMKATRGIKAPRVEVPKVDTKVGTVKTLNDQEITQAATKLLELFNTLGADTTYVERWNKSYRNSPAWMDWKYVGKANYKELYDQVKDPKFTDLYQKTMEHVYDMTYIGAEFHKLKPYVMAMFQLIEKSVKDS